MKQSPVHSFADPQDQRVMSTRGLLTAQRMLIVAWVGVGMVPFILQTRSFLNFVTPHKITETLVAPPGAERKTQYISIGYNLSGMLLLVWEIIENMRWLDERKRMMVKRLLYSYESSLMGEILSAAVQKHFLVALNRSDLQDSRPTALAVSYYAWSLLWHTVYVTMLIGFIVSVRVLWAVVYVLSTNRTLKIFTRPCCIDTVLGPRCRMVMLESYRVEDERLFYKAQALKAFGMLKTEEEDGAEFLVVNKLHWITVPNDNLVVIGSVSGRLVQPCRERACTGAVGFFCRSLGGAAGQPGSNRILFIRRNTHVGPAPLTVVPAP